MYAFWKFMTQKLGIANMYKFRPFTGYIAIKIHDTSLRSVLRCSLMIHDVLHGRIQRGDRGSGTPIPPEKSQHIGFLTITDPNP